MAVGNILTALGLAALVGGMLFFGTVIFAFEGIAVVCFLIPVTHSAAARSSQ